MERYDLVDIARDIFIDQSSEIITPGIRDGDQHCFNCRDEEEHADVIDDFME